jgi:cytochrome c
MDSWEWNKIAGAVLGTLIFVMVVKIATEAIYEVEPPAKPGYVVEGVEETPAAGAAAAPAEEPVPDWGTVLASANVKAGQEISHKCEQCHDLSKGGPNKIGPNLYGVVDRPRAAHEGFAYSSAMKAKPGNWTYDELFKFIKAPGVDIPGTKMSFAGLRSDKDRINLIAFLRSNADSPAAIPAPAPKQEAAPAAAPAAGAGPATAAAPAKGAAPAEAAKPKAP